METRPYFIFGDVISSVLAGAAVGAVMAALISVAWPMPATMLAGMFLGMALCIPIQTACSLLFGAFEVMVPMMLTSMLAGMVVAMRASMLEMPVGEGALWGVCIGLPVLAFTYAANAMLAGEGR
jgi:hypothetical protein